jgi:glycosyltransferase involved in cell wall biosynthesis
MKLTEKKPKVSVCVITYNQEHFIGQCLQSIVDQKTDFEFEIIVGDDCSSDGTRSVINRFQKSFPSLIRTIYQDKNTGGTKNYIDVHSAACGEYVAHIDGDDYMLPNKLMIQAAFLDANPGCSIVAHQVITVDSNGIQKREKKKNTAIVKTDIVGLVRNYLTFTHSSKMYRRNACSGVQYDGSQIIDFVFHVDHAANGWIAVLPDYLGSRRIVANSITNVSEERLYALVRSTRAGFDHARLLGVDPTDVRFGEASYLFKSAIFCAERGDCYGFGTYIEDSFHVYPSFSFPQRIFYAFRSHFVLIRAICRLRRSLK